MVIGLSRTSSEPSGYLFSDHRGILFVLPTRYAGDFGDYELVVFDVGWFHPGWTCILRDSWTKGLSWTGY